MRAELEIGRRVLHYGELYKTPHPELVEGWLKQAHHEGQIHAHIGQPVGRVELLAIPAVSQHILGNWHA